MDIRKIKKQTVKKYMKGGMTRGKATERVTKQIKDFKTEAKHHNNIALFFEKNNIEVLEFNIENINKDNVKFLFNLPKKSIVEDVESDLKLSNIDKKGYINMNTLELINFHIFCASISVVFEEERAAKEVDYLRELYFRVFLECLLYHKHNTFNLLKAAIKSKSKYKTIPNGLSREEKRSFILNN
jgi:hypothetical protein